MAFLAAGIVSAAEREIPPDMRLLRARRAGGSAQRSAGDPALEILAPEEDSLVARESPARDDHASFLLWRPIADLHLSHIGWSREIDHAALQAALACVPRDWTRIEPRFGELLRTYAPLPSAGFAPDRGNAALEVAPSVADLALFEALAGAADEFSTKELARALVLPERIVGAAGTQAQAAVTELLSAYRRACLGHAWGVRLALAGGGRLARERDETAVALLSALRAILGER